MSRSWPFRITWRHRSRDHSNPDGSFPIGGPLDPSLYLHPFSWYLALSILGSRPWPFWVTWRIPGSHFLYVFHWHQIRIFNRCRDNGPQIYWGHDLDLAGSRDVISHVTIRIPMGHFLLVVHWTQISISIRFSRYLSLSILGSRPWPFWVTWRHRSRDH